MSTEIPPLKTRKPTGKPPWPLVLLAGAEKCGKSYSAAAFSASDLIDRTFWIEIGEGAADQYGAIPGTRYEIVEHDGSYVGIGRAVRAATMQPRPNGKPHAIVIDSMTELWDMLSEEQQIIANQRRKRGVNGEAPITNDQWNVAKKRWKRILKILRTYDGPVILTARLDLVTVMDGDRPTKEKTLKVRAEKNLPFEVDAVMKIPAPRQYELTGVRSVVLEMPKEGTLPMPDFTVDGLLRRLGLDQVGATLPRAYTAPAPDAAEALEDAAKMAAAEQQAEQQAAAPAPLRVPQPARPHSPAGLERDRPQQPQQDEWTQPAPAEQIEDAEIVPETDPFWDTDEGKHALTVLHALIGQKSGPKTSEERHAGFTGFCHREITSAKQMRRDEVERMTAAFRKASDFVAPKPQSSPEQQREASARSEAEQLAATDEPDAERIEQAHRDAIESAESAASVDIVLAMVAADVAKRLLGNKQRDDLVRAATVRKDTLRSDQGWAEQQRAPQDAPVAEALAA